MVVPGATADHRHAGERHDHPMVDGHPRPACGFGLLYASYFIIILFEVWFVFRIDIIETAARSRGLKRRLYSVLALGVYDTSPEARALLLAGAHRRPCSSRPSPCLRP